jgi:thioredoxin-related protein
MRGIIYVSFFLLTLTACDSRKSASDDMLIWLTIEEANKIHSEGSDKKFIVDVYTDWCHWCKVMDKKTFADPEVVKYLNDNFHMVKFNAEQKESVKHKGKEYKWESLGRNGVNMLAYELLNGNMGYPSLVYLNENLDPIVVSPGYKESGQLLNELKSLQ